MPETRFVLGDYEQMVMITYAGGSNGGGERAVCPRSRRQSPWEAPGDTASEPRVGLNATLARGMRDGNTQANKISVRCRRFAGVRR